MENVPREGWPRRVARLCQCQHCTYCFLANFYQAGLFSAVVAMVTTFVAQTSQSLQLDHTQVTVSVLYELTNVQRAAANGVLVDIILRSGLMPFSDFRPATTDLWVNGLWFTSLSLSLATAWSRC